MLLEWERYGRQDTCWVTSYECSKKFRYWIDKHPTKIYEVRIYSLNNNFPALIENTTVATLQEATNLCTAHFMSNCINKEINNDYIQNQTVRMESVF